MSADDVEIRVERVPSLFADAAAKARAAFVAEHGEAAYERLVEQAAIEADLFIFGAAYVGPDGRRIPPDRISV